MDNHSGNNHVSFEDVETYLRDGCYPSAIKDNKVKKANFRKACKPFSLLNGQLMYKGTKQVIASSEKQTKIVKDVHAGLGEDSKAKAMASHRGRDATREKISSRFFWHNIKGDVDEFIKKCDQCQRQGKFKKISAELQSIPVKNEVMQQIGVDLCDLPEVDGFKHLIVCIDYFSKWSEAKPVSDKTAPTIAQFLYEVICRHGCVEIQINDQGREFVNQVIVNSCIK